MPTLVKTLTGTAIKHVATNVYNAVSTVIAVDNRVPRYPNLLEWLTSPYPTGLAIPERRATGYVDMCESRGYSNIRALLGVTKGGLRYMIGDCRFETNADNQR